MGIEDWTAMADGDNFDKHGKQGWTSTARRFYERDEGLEDSASRSLRKMFKFGSCSAYREIVDVIVDGVTQRHLISEWHSDVSKQLDQIRLRHGDEMSRGLVRIA